MTAYLITCRTVERGLLKLMCVLMLAAALSTASVVHAQESAPTPSTTDPRIGLKPGWMDAEHAISNLELLASLPRPERFFDAADLGNILVANSDMAFQGSLLFMGNFHGFQVFDISNPRSPRLRVAVECPGGQGDPSVLGNLLFMSVEMPNGRIDCGTQGAPGMVNRDRFRGVRIFDISDLDNPRQVAAVQTCRGSHTHTLMTDPNDDAHVYVYVSGTSGVRPAEELEGCSGGAPDADPNTALFRIEVIRVPLAAPQNATIVSEPRIFADRETGAIQGLWRGGHHGPGTQTSSQTDQCHDITTYPAIGLAAGACSGNGILLDISDPANPRRIDEVTDPNFAYWHSATFNNDGTKVIFTDEWGGGMSPRCRATDRPEWGANAIFDIVDGRMRLAGYYKLPVPQTALENCVAHNGSLIPVPGRDIMVQAWYQGGVSVFDFTDSSNPVEIAFFDRGPLSATQLHLGGFFSTYWYNGHIYASEMSRGLDIFQLTPSEHLSQNEIDAANLVRFEELNPQHQSKMVWPASVVVARAYLDQLVRSDGIARDRATRVASELVAVERATAGSERQAALTRLQSTAAQLEADARAAEARERSTDVKRLQGLASTMRELARARN